MKQILFTPQRDITAYELAVIVGNIGYPPEPHPISKLPIPCSEPGWEEMPPEIKRHWTVL